jgi:hypothetical protein
MTSTSSTLRCYPGKLLFAFFYLFILPVFLKAQYVPGTSYFSPDNYIEYIAGNLPLVITAPHGGSLQPSSIPDRNCPGCSYLKDSYTQELTRELKDAVYNKTGCYPHVIVNLLHRIKLDANRDISDAADSNLVAENAWHAFHDFIDTAKSQALGTFSKGLYLDIHGHAHAIQRLELGYRLSKATLQMSDSLINTITNSSINNLSTSNLNALNLSQLIRGTSAFGTFCENKGYNSVPSQNTPFPLTSESYFSGGYNTGRHGSSSGGAIDGIQIECHSVVRFNAAARQDFVDSLANVIVEYMGMHYFIGFSPNYCLATSVNEISEPQINFFPNPVQDVIYVKSSFYPLNISVFNNLGQLLLHKVIYDDSEQIDISEIACGLFYIDSFNEQTGHQMNCFSKICP